MVRDQGQDSDAVRGIVLAGEGWHAGVVGIVAARMVDDFRRPAVIIALEDGMGQGSGRSIANFPLYDALHGCREHLETFGGHAMAAGLRIRAENIDAFRDAFQARAGALLTHRDLTPRLRLDGEATLAELDEQLVRDLDRMEPFGAGNPAPRLATGWLNLAADPRTVGATQDHLQVVLADDRVQRKGIAFGMAKHRSSLMDHRRCRVAFQPILNEWQGRRSVELKIIDFQFPEG